MLWHVEPMKTVGRNISIAQDLDNFALEQVEEGGYGNVSAYYAELVRERRQKQIDADAKLLADAARGAPKGPAPVEKIVATSKAVRRQMRREKWTPRV